MIQPNEIPYSDQPFVAEALTYIYIAQYVRPDGPKVAGVLIDDCQKYTSQINKLLSERDVQPARWVQLNGYTTTGTGTQKAQAIMQNEVLTSSDTIKKELENVKASNFAEEARLRAIEYGYPIEDTIIKLSLTKKMDCPRKGTFVHS